MNYEEKAKAYDSIIEKANKMHSENCEACQACIEELIPELAENEDERIRKAIVNAIHNYAYRLEEKIPTEWLVWLEKQGEHANFRNKIQVGDKVTRNEDGILVNLSQLKRVAKPMEKQGEQKASYTTIVETGDGGINALVTRELHTNGEQKPAEWSEDDEVGFGDVLWAIEQARTIAKDENDMGNLWCAERWLKSLKGRVQPKQEWSEEDERERKRIIGLLEGWLSTFKETCYAEDCKCGIDWLKSLRPHNRWKPSDEQMEALYKASKNEYLKADQYDVLSELLNNLKKLKDK